MNKLPFIIIAFAVFIADQLSKWGVMEYVIRPHLGEEYGISRSFWLWLKSAPERLPYAELDLLPFFNLVMVWNQGVSFGLFNGDTDFGPWLLGGLAVVIILIFSVWLLMTDNKFQGFALALIIGGAAGNVMDRARFGAVVDFLDFHAFGWHWPAFNVSDSCICIGVFLLIVEGFFFENRFKNAT